MLCNPILSPISVSVSNFSSQFHFHFRFHFLLFTFPYKLVNGFVYFSYIALQSMSLYMFFSLSYAYFSFLRGPMYMGHFVLIQLNYLYLKQRSTISSMCTFLDIQVTVTVCTNVPCNWILNSQTIYQEFTHGEEIMNVPGPWNKKIVYEGPDHDHWDCKLEDMETQHLSVTLV